MTIIPLIILSRQSTQKALETSTAESYLKMESMSLVCTTGRGGGEGGGVQHTCCMFIDVIQLAWTISCARNIYVKKYFIIFIIVVNNNKEFNTK